MGILDWWRGRGAGSAGDPARISEAVERIVQTTNPRLKFVRRYHARLAPAVETSLDYLRDLVASLPAAREATAAGWSSDPCMHAFFAVPDDVAQAFSRSPELRAFFDQKPAIQEVYAVLGMEMTERQILGMAMEGGETIRRDVPQTTVSFSDHRVTMCGCTDADLRREIERRMMDQLALEGLARVAADHSRRGHLEQERALLKVRLRLLEGRGAGMRSVLGGDAAVGPTELARLQQQLDENTRNLGGARVGKDTLDHELERVREVLAEPKQYFYISNKRLRLDRMNVVQAENSPQGGEEIEFQVARVPGNPPRSRAFAVVRFPRAGLLAGGLRLDEAAKLLL